ncbi:MAG: hypothetical protein EPO35_00860 [Acidobacteria bacterium]|nr:MAG: hypothetical protein EPO35_00860 [Acidobacteriota bacterium]
MSGLKRLSSFPDLTASHLVVESPCECLADFFRREIVKHQLCLERQREYYSDVAIRQAEQALMRTLEQVECLCKRADATQVIGELLQKFDAVTNLSAFTDLQHLH